MESIASRPQCSAAGTSNSSCSSPRSSSTTTAADRSRGLAHVATRNGWSLPQEPVGPRPLQGVAIRHRGVARKAGDELVFEQPGGTAAKSGRALEIRGVTEQLVARRTTGAGLAPAGRRRARPSCCTATRIGKNVLDGGAAARADRDRPRPCSVIRLRRGRRVPGCPRPGPPGAALRPARYGAARHRIWRWCAVFRP